MHIEIKKVQLSILSVVGKSKKLITILMVTKKKISITMNKKKEKFLNLADYSVNPFQIPALNRGQNMYIMPV